MIINCGVAGLYNTGLKDRVGAWVAKLPLRAMARRLDKLKARPWASHPHLEAVEADVFDPISLERASAGCRWAYYLIRSMIAKKSEYAAADRKAANNMVKVAADTGMERMVGISAISSGRCAV